MTVQHPFIAIQFSLQTDVAQVATSIRLAIALTPDVVTGNDARQVVTLLFLASEQQECVAQHLDAEHIVHRPGWHPGAGELFSDNNLFECRQSTAAVGRWPTRCQISALGEMHSPLSDKSFEFLAVKATDALPAGG